MKFPDYKMPYTVSKHVEQYEEKEEEKEVRKVKVYKAWQYKLKEIKAEQPQHKTIFSLQRLIKDMQTEESMALPKIGTDVSGDLFDRIRFLKERIDELEKAIKMREEMNIRFNREIERDIEEMERVTSAISNIEELREFKMHVTLLRMEKRKENTNFWKDILELKKQLKELKEEYETELKISNMFSDLGGLNG